MVQHILIIIKGIFTNIYFSLHVRYFPSIYQDVVIYLQHCIYTFFSINSHIHSIHDSLWCIFVFNIYKMYVQDMMMWRSIYSLIIVIQINDKEMWITCHYILWQDNQKAKQVGILYYVKKCIANLQSIMKYIEDFFRLHNNIV